MIGQTLSHYRITSALGAGGMGEVYRATDTKLDREVAIKVLPPEVVEDPERLARFEREAQLLASLNHPNIAAIYGLEEADGQPVPGPGARRGRGPQGAARAGPDPRRRGPRDRRADRRGPRGGPRQGHRPPRPQARQRQAHARREGQGPRLRPGQGLGGRRARRELSSRRSPSPRPWRTRDAGRRDPGHRRLHVARAGAGQARGQAGGRLVLRRAAVGDADRAARSSPATRSPTSSPRW